MLQGIFLRWYKRRLNDIKIFAIPNHYNSMFRFKISYLINTNQVSTFSILGHYEKYSCSNTYVSTDFYRCLKMYSTYSSYKSAYCAYVALCAFWKWSKDD